MRTTSGRTVRRIAFSSAGVWRVAAVGLANADATVTTGGVGGGDATVGVWRVVVVAGGEAGATGGADAVAAGELRPSFSSRAIAGFACLTSELPGYSA